MPETSYKPFCIEVWSDYACFTRPELKVERLSYDVPTPSAVRAVFEAIFWKPAIRWQVNKIEVLNPIKWISLRRNEIGALMSPQSEGLYINDLRQQRGGRFLHDVRYRFYATLDYIPETQRQVGRSSAVLGSLWQDDESTLGREEIKLNQNKAEHYRPEESPGKYLAMFERRARKGQCFNQPYLGCREFSCNFHFVDQPEEEAASPIKETRDLGIMLYDMDFTDAGNPQPLFFRARIEHGVVHIPPRESKEVLR
ncbi:MAG TPA: type I-C CRISPR-associated protein Cas5c [bacterium]|mgnify:CR=1 FL=1|nr:type I-C CRISPR-associated protein Cas5c [bacterium]HQJ64145.1 type I-C CRISPR-associated protein Cas5c [bacterium]